MGMFANLPDLPKEPKSKGYQGMFADLPDAPKGEPELEPAGFFEAAVRDPLEKIPFSPMGLAETGAIATASMRLKENQYEAAAKRVMGTAQATSGGFFPGYGKVKKITPESLKAADTKLLTDHFNKLAKRGKQGYTLMGRVGQITSNMPAYMIEFLATGGIKTLGTRGAQWVGTKILRESAKKGLGKVAVSVSKFSAGAGTRAFIGMPHRAADTILKRTLPKGITIDDLGDPKLIESGESTWTSIWKGSLDHYIEIASEQAGEFMGPAIHGAIGKMPMLGKAVGAMQRAWLKKFPTKSATDFLKKIGTKAGFNGVLGEIGEEDLGWIARALFDIEDFGAGKDATVGERLKAGLAQDVENLPAELIAFSIPVLAGKAVSHFVPEDTPPIEPTPEKASPLERVYMKGFTARLTSIRNNADNIIAGAGEKGSQLKVMKEELSKIENHYESIAKDIKENPELLAELGQIDKLLPDYSRAIDSFVDSPSKKGFEEIKAVGSKIAELSTSYGVRIGEQTAKPVGGKAVYRAGKMIGNLIHVGSEKAARKASVGKKDIVKGEIELNNPAKMIDSGRAHNIKPIALAEDIEKGNNIGLEHLGDAVKRIKKMRGDEAAFEAIGQALKANGYDGVIYTNVNEDPGSTSYIILGKDQFTTEAQMAAKPKETFAEQVAGLEKLAEERGLKPEVAPGERKFKEPDVTHFLTPQVHQAELLGVKFMTKPAELGKQRLDIEFNRHVRDLNKIERLINKLGGETAKSKAAAKLKNVPTKSVARFRELLNTNETAPPELSEKETAIFNYFRNLSSTLFVRENEARAKVGLEPIPYRTNYVRHIAAKMAQEMIDGRYPIPEDIKFWAEERVKTKITNPMEFQRELEDKLEYSRDIIWLSKAMMWTGLREIHLSEPLKFFEGQLALHSEVIPPATRRWTEKFINHMVKGQETDVDKSLNALVTDSGLRGIFNKVLAPFGRIISHRPLTNLFQKVGRLQIYGVMGWRPKQLIRNKFQLVQNLALYTMKANLKAFFPANKQLKGMMSESLFLETYKGFEDLTTIDKNVLGRMWLAPFQWTAVSNARQAFKVAYWDTLDLIENKKYKDLGWADPKRTYKEKSGFLYQSEKEKILKEMEFGAGVTQYHYIPMAMPEVFRHKALIPFTRLQSWWMNYFFKFQREAGTRFLKGETGYGQKLPWSRRIGWARYMIIGGVILNTLGYAGSYVFGAAPDSFPPIGKLLIGMLAWLKAIQTGNIRTKKSAERKMLGAVKTFIPGYLAYKDWSAILSGEKPLSSLFFYNKGIFAEKEQKRGRRRAKRKRPTRRTRR